MLALESWCICLFYESFQWGLCLIAKESKQIVTILSNVGFKTRLRKACSWSKMSRYSNGRPSHLTFPLEYQTPILYGIQVSNSIQMVTVPFPCRDLVAEVKGWNPFCQKLLHLRDLPWHKISVQCVSLRWPETFSVWSDWRFGGWVFVCSAVIRIFQTWAIDRELQSPNGDTRGKKDVKCPDLKIRIYLKFGFFCEQS